MGVLTAESPTRQKSHDNQEISRNSSNLLVASGHIENEGDDSQVNSLSPSNINIQNSKEVTFSIILINEGAQSSASMPSEGESVGNVLDVQYKTNQLIYKHQEIERQKRNFEELCWYRQM